MPESACPSKNGAIDLRVDSIPFREIPGQSKLFLDFLSSSADLSEYYPNAVSKFDELVGTVPSVLEGYETDRAVLCKMLEEQNVSFGCGNETLENIELLLGDDCVAVLTGQQAGLFTGPLYSIYKALTAIRGAAQLREKGIKAVPVFWIASEDHDLEEVSNAFAISKNGELFESRIASPEVELGKPVGSIHLAAEIEGLIDELTALMPETEFSDGVRATLRSTYSAEETFASSFARLLTKLLGQFGLIVFDPMDVRAKELSAEIVSAAVQNTGAIVEALIARSKDLIASGYHAQVLVEDDYFPVFWIDGDGIRRSLKRIGDGRYRASGTRKDFTTSDLLEMAKREPEVFSPGVMLRPVVQDVLFPTICYFGGGAEIAYFAQNSEVYRILGRRVTPILPRQSFTVVEAKHERTLKKYGIEFKELFDGIEKLRPRIVEQVIDPETPTVFAEADTLINSELDRLARQLSKIDPTLAESLEKRRVKISYHVAALRKKFQRASIEKDETIKRQIGSMFDSLMPHGGLQERTLNVSVFANRYGGEFVSWVYDAIDLNDDGHKLVHL